MTPECGGLCCQPRSCVPSVGSRLCAPRGLCSVPLLLCTIHLGFRNMEAFPGLRSSCPTHLQSCFSLAPRKQVLSLISLPLDLGLPTLVLEVAKLFLDLQVWLPPAHSFSAARGMVSEGWRGHAISSPSTCLWPFSP